MIYEGSYKIYFYDKLFQFPFFNNIYSCRRVKFIFKKKCSKNLFFINEKSYSIPGLEHTPMYTLQMFFANARHQNTMQHLKQ